MGSQLGTITQYLYSTNSPVCPESVGSNWKYWNGEDWLDAQGNAKMIIYRENSCSNEVYMHLDGQAHDKQYEKAGKYTKANGLSSGMPYWIESNGTHALWFTNGQWRVGKKS